MTQEQSDKPDTGLLPCPCCGGAANFDTVRTPGRQFGAHFVECQGCGLTTNLVYNLKGGADNELREVWNRRTVRPELGRNAEAIAKIDKAHQHVADLAAGREKWTMRVPARPDLDSDLIIADALATAKRLLEATVVPSAKPFIDEQGHYWTLDELLADLDGGGYLYLTPKMCSDLAATLRAATASTSGQWQAMVTAPLDGTEIDILFRHNHYWLELKLHGKEEAEKLWQAVQRAKWIDHNGGGWTWHGMVGTPIGWRPVATASASGERS